MRPPVRPLAAQHRQVGGRLRGQCIHRRVDRRRLHRPVGVAFVPVAHHAREQRGRPAVVVARVHDHGVERVVVARIQPLDERVDALLGELDVAVHDAPLLAEAVVGRQQGEHAPARRRLPAEHARLLQRGPAVVRVEGHHQPVEPSVEHRVGGAPGDAVDVAVLLGAYRDAGLADAAERAVGGLELRQVGQLRHVEVAAGDGEGAVGDEGAERIHFAGGGGAEEVQHGTRGLEGPAETVGCSGGRGVDGREAEDFADDLRVHPVDDPGAVGVADVVVGVSEQQDPADAGHGSLPGGGYGIVAIKP